jgi:hypothetical protein
MCKCYPHHSVFKHMSLCDFLRSMRPRFVTTRNTAKTILPILNVFKSRRSGYFLGRIHASTEFVPLLTSPVIPLC